MTSRAAHFALAISLAANAVLLTAFLLTRTARVPPDVARSAVMRSGKSVSREKILPPSARISPNLPAASPLTPVSPLATEEPLVTPADANPPQWSPLENVSQEKWEQLQSIAADYG